MNKQVFILVSFILTTFILKAQDAYQDSMKSYINHYVEHHDVISGEDKKFFRFFPVNKTYLVKAKFTKVASGRWFEMQTSGKIKKTFRVYGILAFTIHDTAVTLPVYQMQNLMQDSQYGQYLFLPFTDLTTGIESYHTGRYIDFTIPDIKNGEVYIDFNKAYNPSCAYVSGKYNCPVPPKENNLPVAITAGEMSFSKNE